MGNQRLSHVFSEPLIPEYALFTDDYEPTDQLPRSLRRLHGRLIADLLDAILHYGVVGETITDRELMLRTTSNRNIFALAHVPDDTRMTSIKLCAGTGSKTLRRPELRIITRQATLFWPTNVSVADVRDGLRDIDTRMCDGGFMNRDTGIRTGIYDPNATGTLRVHDFFRLPETMLRLPPNDLSSSLFVRRFDDPDALAWTMLSDGSVRICLGKDVEIIRKKERMKSRVLQSVYDRFGIMSNYDLARLDADQRRQLENAYRRAVRREIARLERG